MHRSGLSPFSRFRGRPARFEQARNAGPERQAWLRRLSRRAVATGINSIAALSAHLAEQGIAADMPRLARLAEALPDAAQPVTPGFLGRLSDDTLSLIERSLTGTLAVPDFRHFAHRVAGYFDYALENRRGEVARYIPELARQAPDAFGLALCTIDGQLLALGDAQQRFCLQSVVKPLNYALALALNGENLVHRHVGREPSGLRFNEPALDPGGRPQNPMINSGAIMCASLIRPSQDAETRAELVRRFVASAAGGANCEIDMAVYASEQATAERNRSLVRLMIEHDAFPEGSDTQAALDLYFRTCALTLDCNALACVAAMLANGGVCPLTGHRVIDAGIVRHTLSLMLTCGMYDYSGEFAFVVGLPAKSGVSGGLMIVIPGIGGFGLFSPRLDRQGNSVRGVEFCKRLVEDYPFHIFAGVTSE